MFLLVRLSLLLLLLFVLLVVRETKANEKCEKNVSAASLPVPAALLPVSLLLLPRVAKLSGDKKYENFDAATRFRFASKLFRSAQPVSVAAYYCVFVPTVAARCRSSTQRAAHSSHAHTPHSVRSLFVCRSLAAWHWQSSSVSGDNQPPECIARSLARTQQDCVLCCVVRSLTHALVPVLCSLSTQQMAALSADLCLYIYLACALCTSAVLRAWCCRCRRRLRRRRCRCRRQSVSARSVC